MDIASWSVVAGLVLVVMALGDSVLARLPISTAILYLLLGVAASPVWLGWTSIDLRHDFADLERLAEVVILLSLFSAGLRMSAGLGDGRWLLPLRLATVSMLATVAFIAVLGTLWLDLPPAAAILLGGMLAPTDPVLAADVQLVEAGDRDRLRFALTGEAGLNDGTAMPVVLLGLGLLGLHDLGPSSWRWFGVDVLWGLGGGVVIGALLGTGVGRLVLYLRRSHKEAVGADNFLALGLVALAFGAASLASANTFLAVFAAGFALRRLELQQPRPPPRTKASTANREAARTKADASAKAFAAEVDDPHAAIARVGRLATDPQHAPAYMTHAVRAFNEQIERIGEVAAVVAIGMLLWAVDWHEVSWLFVAVLIVVIRPLSVAIGLFASRTSLSQRGLTAWFGIRGVGSLYYLVFAIHQGLRPSLASTLAALVLGSVVVSIVVHGVSVTPLMALYERRKRRRGRVRGA